MSNISENNKFILSVLVGSIYFVINLQSSGPTYQQDEIGYLINSAFFAGNVIDGFSSYHTGYSFFLAPIFLFVRNPFDVWPGVVFVNSLFWAGSFYLALKTIKRIYPNFKLGEIIFAMVLCFTYSSWISITGYAFTQSCYVFFYMLSVYLLINGLNKKGGYAIIFSFVMGFLYWIHPTALGPIAASILMAMINAAYRKEYFGAAKHIIIVLFMVITHKLGIQVVMENIMTPQDFAARAHYPSISSVLDSAVSLRFWKYWFLIFIGQITYLTVATFGMFLIGFIKCLRWTIPPNNTHRLIPIDNIRFNVGLYLISTAIFVAAISSASFASQPHSPSVDELFYGRYIESIILPLFLIGSIEYRKIQDVKILMLCLSIILIGYIFNEMAGNFTWINLVNLQGFWPYLIFKQNLTVSFFIGATSVAFVLYLGNRIILIPALLIYTLSITENNDFHSNLYNAYSKPSGLVGFLRGHFKSGQCVAFDEYLPKGNTNLMAERIRLYSFYFYDYKFSRQYIENWYAHCAGPMLSFKKQHDFDLPVNLLAREKNTGLGLFIKSADCKPLNVQCDKIEEF